MFPMKFRNRIILNKAQVSTFQEPYFVKFRYLPRFDTKEITSH